MTVLVSVLGPPVAEPLDLPLDLSLDFFDLPPAPPSPTPALPRVPIGDPRREREMVCDLEAGLGFCPAETGFLGPLDRCRRQIGTIGFQLGGEAICWSCFVRLTAVMASAPAPTVDTSVFETSVDSASQAEASQAEASQAEASQAEASQRRSHAL